MRLVFSLRRLPCRALPPCSARMKPAATIRRLTLPIPAALAPGVGANVRGFLPLSVAASAATNLHSRGLATARRPFRVLGLQQVAVGAESKNDMRKIWQDMLGLEKHGEFRSEKENVDEDILTMGRGIGKVEIDIMAPIDVNKSPKVHTPNLNHIGLWIDNLDECVAWLKSSGVRFAGGIRVGAAGHRVAFIHPKGNEESPIGGAGVLIELVQAPLDIIESYDVTPPS